MISVLLVKCSISYDACQMQVQMIPDHIFINDNSIECTDWDLWCSDSVIALDAELLECCELQLHCYATKIHSLGIICNYAKIHDTLFIMRIISAL